MNNENIPPLIAGWIESMLNTKSPMHIRENYHNTLRTIKDVVDTALSVFEQDRAREAAFRKKS